LTDSIRGWTVYLCRSSPGAADIAAIAWARGADVCWCGADCSCGKGDQQVSVYDDGIWDAEEVTPEVPETETRGGEAPDWDRARPGQPLPEKPPAPDHGGWLP
jgi:hypothetical protein